MPPTLARVSRCNALTYIVASGVARAADGTNQFPFGPVLKGNIGSAALQPKPKPLNTYNFLPGGVTILHVILAGLPQVPPFGQDAFWGVPKGGFTGYGTLGLPSFGGPFFGDPVFTHRTYSYDAGWARSDACDFEVDCYMKPGLSWNAPGFFPNTGILGAPDYQGGWTAEVDFVNLYVGSKYYPAVPGLLIGESYHVVTGTPGKSEISLTEDAALDPMFVGHSLIANHIGPYSQQGVWQISNAHNSGEASAAFEVDLNGLVTGNALAFTWSNEFRPLSWATLSVLGAGINSPGNSYTYDGIYEMYLQPGRYNFTISSPGAIAQSWSASISGGQMGVERSVNLEQSNIPVPESRGATLVAVSALAASIYVLRRRYN